MGAALPLLAGCRYCYFGTIEEHEQSPPAQAGQLSHLSRDDLPLDDLTAFLRHPAGSAVERVFIAGGEPLDWPPVLTSIVSLIKRRASRSWSAPTASR